MSRVKVEDIVEDYDHLFNLNASYRSYAQELADFFLPRRAWINSIRIRGERVRFKFLYDSTAILSAREAAHGIHSHLTSESTRWFGLQATDSEDMKRHDVRMWFRDLEDKMLDTLRNTNYYNVQLEDYHSKLVFGNGTYSMLEDSKDVVTFKNMPIENVCRVVDDSGRLSEIYVLYRLSAKRAFKIFGTNAGKSVMEAMVKKQPFKEIDFLHYVAERSERDVRFEDSVNMPYKSVWINKSDMHLIAESGFIEMPYISDVFYSDNNDPNGFSPAMDVFPWVKLVNAMSRTVIRAAMKQTDPPIVAPSRGFVLPLNFNPAGMNYRDPKTARDALQLLPTVGGRVEISFELMKFVTERIQQGMFLPLFQSLNNITKQLSVLEAQHIINQNMAILGPVVGRFDYGTLSPMIFRLYGILSRNGEVPPPPEVLVGKNFRVIYLGQLAKAQRQSEVGEIQSWLQEVQAVSSVLPNALHNVDEDKLIRHLHKIRHLSPEFMRKEEDIERIRAIEAEQQQLMKSMAAGQGAANIAKASAQAQKESAMAESA